MRCELSISETDANGWHTYRCNRVGCPSAPKTPHSLDRIVNNTVCRGLPHWHELGGWLALFIGIFGITQRNYNWLRYKLGFVKPCGCQQREAALNTLGSRFNQALAWLTGYNTHKGER
jgi:hypothetical protein